MNNDLISRNALLSKRRTIKPPECNSCEYEHMEYVRAEDVQNAPAVDAIEVVRCKDCIKHYNSRFGHVVCTYFEKLVRADDYCSYGAKKDTEVENHA